MPQRLVTWLHFVATADWHPDPDAKKPTSKDKLVLAQRNYTRQLGSPMRNIVAEAMDISGFPCGPADVLLDHTSLHPLARIGHPDIYVVVRPMWSRECEAAQQELLTRIHRGMHRYRMECLQDELAQLKRQPEVNLEIDFRRGCGIQLNTFGEPMATW